MIDDSCQKLTNFQRKCCSKTLDLLQGQKYKISIEELDILCVLIKLDIQRIEIWIYDDECMFLGEKIDERFESCDFDSEDALISQFISDLTKKLGIEI